MTPRISTSHAVTLMAAGLVSLAALGCAGSEESTTTVAQTSTETPETEAHGEWWCGEHGVPEEECAQCDASLVAGFKEKGDWCDEHNRPDSQCFICHPENKAKFAAKYEAKYNAKPPEPTAAGAEGEEHVHEHEGDE
jgi:hypothetical protein